MERKTRQGAWKVWVYACGQTEDLGERDPSASDDSSDDDGDNLDGSERGSTDGSMSGSSLLGGGGGSGGGRARLLDRGGSARRRGDRGLDCHSEREGGQQRGSVSEKKMGDVPHQALGRRGDGAGGRRIVHSRRT